MIKYIKTQADMLAQRATRLFMDNEVKEATKDFARSCALTRCIRDLKEIEEPDWTPNGSADVEQACAPFYMTNATINGVKMTVQEPFRIEKNRDHV